MRGLLAAPDRDFLTSYQKLYELDGNEITVAFDGYQVMTRLQEDHYDFLLLDRELPRVGHGKLLKLVNDLNVSAIVLQKHRITAKQLLEDHLADSYLVYPFWPEELFERQKRVFQKRQCDAVLHVGDAPLRRNAFQLGDAIRVTNEEIDICEYLLGMENGKGEMENRMELPVRHGMYYINALNQKFEKLGKHVRIQYFLKEGYRMVV